jgi:hypothetical protein
LNCLRPYKLRQDHTWSFDREQKAEVGRKEWGFEFGSANAEVGNKPGGIAQAFLESVSHSVNSLEFKTDETRFQGTIKNE